MVLYRIDLFDGYLKEGPEAIVAMKQKTLPANLNLTAAMRKQRGGSVVIEMVFSFSLLMFIAMGMVEFGQYFYIKHAFEAAARDAARASILATATASSPATAATYTLSEANVTFNSSWLTITDTTAGSTVSDVSTVPAGDILQVQLLATYDQIPNVLRPLYSMTGQGIKNGKPMLGQCTMVRE
jgi:Flp pilus assembly protein TadG